MVSYKGPPQAWPKGGGRLGKLLDQAMDAKVGGFQTLLTRFDEAGLLPSVAAWRSDPASPPLTAQMVRRLFSPEELIEIAAALALEEDGLVEMLTTYLPARIHDRQSLD
jgi:uncharacterized protein YidB (DUF937 family)